MPDDPGFEEALKNEPVLGCGEYVKADVDAVARRIDDLHGKGGADVTAPSRLLLVYAERQAGGSAGLASLVRLVLRAS